LLGQRQLGRGAHAKVYEATLGDQWVALKVLNAHDPTALHEARMVRGGYWVWRMAGWQRVGCWVWAGGWGVEWGSGKHGCSDCSVCACV
jgi:hypothetical protein